MSSPLPEPASPAPDAPSPLPEPVSPAPDSPSPASEPPTSKPTIPASAKTRMVQSRGRVLTLVGIAVLLGIFAGAIAFALSYPLTKAPVRPLAQGVDLSAVLAPIIIAALGVERIIEMMWNLVESYIRSLVAFLAGRSEWLRWANDELKAARERLEALAHEGDPTLRVGDLLPTNQDALSQLIERAAGDVALAEVRLSSLTSTQQYRDAKRVISILTSLLLGIIVSTVIGLQMFALLGINVHERVDLLITGIAIGTGSTPVHSLVGILQQGKDALDGVQQALKLRNVQNVREIANQ